MNATDIFSLGGSGTVSKTCVTTRVPNRNDPCSLSGTERLLTLQRAIARGEQNFQDSTVSGVVTIDSRLSGGISDLVYAWAAKAASPPSTGQITLEKL